MSQLPMFPNDLRPMPLKRHREPFSRPDWLYEIKHDGFRALAFVRDGSCRLVSRNGNDFKSFGTLSSAIPKYLKAKSAVLDGEVVCLDEQGRSQFNELLFRRGEPRFFAFDLLWCDGKDLRYDALHGRKRQLKSIIRSDGHLLYCDHIEEQGEDLFRLVCANDLEGIVAKPKNSPYLFSESETPWLKMKNPNYTQSLGRDDLFVPGRKKPPEPDWAGCVLACAEAEM